MRAPIGERGQATVEYLVVGLALIAVIAGMAALWRHVSEQPAARNVEQSASHSAEAAGGVADALLY